jgi:hypothetical protein
MYHCLWIDILFETYMGLLSMFLSQWPGKDHEGQDALDAGEKLRQAKGRDFASDHIHVRAPAHIYTQCTHECAPHQPLRPQYFQGGFIGLRFHVFRPQLLDELGVVGLHFFPPDCKFGGCQNEI